MMTACRYAILRFLPFVETGEFANVGVVLMSTTGRYFGFKLLKNRIARVTHFFELRDPKALRVGLLAMRAELERIESTLKRFGTDRRLRHVNEAAIETIFAELVRPREALFRFGTPRAVLTDNVERELAELYAKYVERDFATKEYQEKVIERAVRMLLTREQLADRFVPQVLGDDVYSIELPFVHKRSGTDIANRIIKPLHLTHLNPARAIDHGLEWAGKVAQLKKRNLLQGEILFAIKGLETTNAHREAKQEVEQLLNENAGTITAEHDDEGKILSFARAA